MAVRPQYVHRYDWGSGNDVNLLGLMPSQYRPRAARRDPAAQCSLTPAPAPWFVI
jgi:hypothetical protein